MNCSPLLQVIGMVVGSIGIPLNLFCFTVLFVSRWSSKIRQLSRFVCCVLLNFPFKPHAILDLYVKIPTINMPCLPFVVLAMWDPLFLSINQWCDFLWIFCVELNINALRQMWDIINNLCLPHGSSMVGASCLSSSFSSEAFVIDLAIEFAFSSWSKQCISFNSSYPKPTLLPPQLPNGL